MALPAAAPNERDDTANDAGVQRPRRSGRRGHSRQRQHHLTRRGTFAGVRDTADAGVVGAWPERARGGGGGADREAANVGGARRSAGLDDERCRGGRWTGLPASVTVDATTAAVSARGAPALAVRKSARLLTRRAPTTSKVPPTATKSGWATSAKNSPNDVSGDHGRSWPVRASNAPSRPPPEESVLPPTKNLSRPPTAMLVGEGEAQIALDVSELSVQPTDAERARRAPVAAGRQDAPATRGQSTVQPEIQFSGGSNGRRSRVERLNTTARAVLATPPWTVPAAYREVSLAVSSETSKVSRASHGSNPPLPRSTAASEPRVWPDQLGEVAADVEGATGDSQRQRLTVRHQPPRQPFARRRRKRKDLWCRRPLGHDDEVANGGQRVNGAGRLGRALSRATGGEVNRHQVAAADAARGPELPGEGDASTGRGNCQRRTADDGLPLQQCRGSRDRRRPARPASCRPGGSRRRRSCRRQRGCRARRRGRNGTRQRRAAGVSEREDDLGWGGPRGRAIGGGPRIAQKRCPSIAGAHDHSAWPLSANAHTPSRIVEPHPTPVAMSRVPATASRSY